MIIVIIIIHHHRHQMKPEVLRQYLSRCQIVHHKSLAGCPGIDPGTPLSEAVDNAPEPLHGLVYCCV